MPKILRSQKEFDEYLVNYGVRLASIVKVEWYSAETDCRMALKTDGVYLHPQILALGLKFLLMSFV